MATDPEVRNVASGYNTKNAAPKLSFTLVWYELSIFPTHYICIFVVLRLVSNSVLFLLEIYTEPYFPPQIRYCLCVS